MPIIKPISDLRNKAREMSRLCHQSGDPIFITKNGEGDMVLMSLAAYERLQARLELYAALDEAEADERAGDRGTSVAALRRKLRR
jgi:prevent-host-death family protein